MLKNQKGFSLIELMIVVAIIGILAAIAVPNFQKFQEKSHQSEAKGNLAAAFSAEQAFFAEYNNYTARFDQMGFALQGNLLYGIGFTADFASAAVGVPGGSANCFTACVGATGCAAANGGFVTWTCQGQTLGAPAPGDMQGTASAALFTVTAAGIINASAAKHDIWSMDYTKTIASVSSGL